MTLDNPLTLSNIESWFIPIDILMITCAILILILAMFYLSIIFLNQTCYTVPMILIVNSYIAAFLFGIIVLWISIFMLQHDLKRIQYQDSLCNFRGFMIYVVTFLQNFSYLLQVIYCYITTVYSNHLLWQSTKFQTFLICLMWIFGFLCPMPYLLTHEIKYDINNEICQMPLRFSFLPIYNIFCIHLIPVLLIILIYLKLVYYVRKMSKHVTLVNTLISAEQELKMVRRIVILVIYVATIGSPNTLFLFLSFFTSLPKYHFRISIIFMNISLVSVMIVLYKITDSLEMSIRRKINRQIHMEMPTIT